MASRVLPARRAHPQSPAPTHDALLACVLGAIDTTLAPTLQPVVHPAGTALLKVLIYCYASGVYCSQDIADSLLSNGTLRWLAEGTAFTPDQLRSFRRHNRELLVSALSETLQGCQVTAGAASARPGTGLPAGYACRSFERWHPGPSLQASQADAERRVGCAVRCDSASLDT